MRFFTTSEPQRILSTRFQKYGDVWSAQACLRFAPGEPAFVPLAVPVFGKAAASCRTPNQSNALAYL